MTSHAPLPSLRGRRVTVMGLGSFSGGVGAVRFLVERGARVTVTDLRSETELAESLAQLDGHRPHALHLGAHQDDDFLQAELVVANPAVRRDNRHLQLARQAGVPLSSEMNLFWQVNRAPVVGVTGSNGKSTTTAMIVSMLTAAGRRTWLGGNIGRSLLPVVDEIQADDWVVLELSSFQLEDLATLEASPRVAVVTNFSPNHLDWHGTVEAYRRAKQSILRYQAAADFAVLNQEDADVSNWRTTARRLWFGMQDRGQAGTFSDGSNIIVRFAATETTLACTDWPTPPGRHNRENSLAAASAALAAGADQSAIVRGLRDFQPLPHRLQLVAETAGRRFYNDSLATTPESAIVALEAFDAPIILLAGGYDKQVDLSAFAQVIARRVKAVALMGQTSGQLADSIAGSGAACLPAAQQCDSFEQAFQWCTRQSAPGDVVLLSPGCASYDWFRNFAERGERFTHLAQHWLPT